jgi:hypothetical protein
MHTLLRVGDKVVNTATVTHIKLNDSGGAVSIEFVGGTGLKLRGKDAAPSRVAERCRAASRVANGPRLRGTGVGCRL